jgi:hypothetical protein
MRALIDRGAATARLEATLLAMMRIRRFVTVPLLIVVAACSGSATGDAAEGTPAEPAATRSVSPVGPTPAEPSPATSPAEVTSPEASAVPGTIAPSEGFDTAEITLTDGEQQVAMPVWVADTPALRQRGLMGRESLPSGAGMVFVFEADSSGGFWMKDTLIPLSIAFIDGGGEIVDVLDMQPCEADPCPVYTPDATYLYALEANLGFFEDHGITAGWTADLDEVLGPP